MALSVIYDPRNHTFDSWASLMVEAYAGQQLQIPSEDMDWKDWAVGLKAIDVFTNEAIPGPYIYENWQDWAQAIVGIVNQRVENV